MRVDMRVKRPIEQSSIMTTMTTIKTYREELQELYHRRIYHITLTGGCLMILFGLLDYLVVPDLFNQFASYRVAVAVCSLALLITNYYDKKKKYAPLIGFTEYVLIALILVIMIYQMGGVASPYYVGLLVAIAIYATLAPLTAMQTLLCGLFIIVCYGVSVQSQSSQWFSVSLELFNNLFFMTCFIFIIATQSFTDTVARKREYRLRRQEQNANEELARHSIILEQEVEKRTLEREATEKRYRLLFNQIGDDVVFLNKRGEVLECNESFENNYNGHGGKKSPLQDIVLPEDHQLLNNLLHNILSYGKPVQGAKFSLKKTNGSICEVEANLSLVTRNHGKRGVLLIMRDLTMRKHLENKLVTSLKLKKQTESAAIMALAKLSEYREFTPEKHLERIREYCQILASQLSGHKEFESEIKENYIQDIYHASILHDIGKVAIPDALLQKTGPLTSLETETIRKHTLLGGDVLQEMEKESQKNSFLPMAKDIAYFHHERWDGTGYPKGLRKNEIPLAARIMALVDLYEELTTVSGTGRQQSHEDAVESIINNSNLSLDPRVVEAFFLCQEEFRKIYVKYTTTIS